MEVHHHTHQPQAHRKKWTHYIWEFLMLFLAVFCGFLAENVREHRVEAHREKQYAASLLEDIRTDSVMLSRLIADYKFVNPRVDTFQQMVNTKPLDAYPPGTWYYYGRFGTRIFTPVFQDATLQQLKTSGGLRYFRKENAVNAIAHYDQACRDMISNSDLQNFTYNEVIVARNRVFNAWYMNEIMNSTVSRKKIDSFMQKEIPFLSEDKNDFIQYASYCQLRGYNNKGGLELAISTLEQAKELMRILEREYNLR